MHTNNNMVRLLSKVERDYDSYVKKSLANHEKPITLLAYIAQLFQ